MENGIFVHRAATSLNGAIQMPQKLNRNWSNTDDAINIDVHD